MHVYVFLRGFRQSLLTLQSSYGDFLVCEVMFAVGRYQSIPTQIHMHTHMIKHFKSLLLVPEVQLGSDLFSLLLCVCVLGLCVVKSQPSK